MEEKNTASSFLIYRIFAIGTITEIIIIILKLLNIIVFPWTPVILIPFAVTNAVAIIAIFIDVLIDKLDKK